jgi:hypothetical protein
MMHTPPEKAQGAMRVMMGMTKLEIAPLKAAST